MKAEIDTARLAAWIAGEPGFGEGTALVAAAPMAGGQSSEMLRLTCRQADGNEIRYVARLEQRGTQLFLKPDIAREYHVISGVARAGTVPVPEPIALEPTGAVLGTPFLVMSEVDGRSPLGRPSLHTSGLVPGLSPDQRRRLAMNGIDAMAALHALDWRETHPFLGNTSEPGGGLRAHLDQLAEWYGWAARGRPYPITDTALAYLQAGIGQLQDTREVFLWGDARPGNILFADDQSVAAVLDWEGALVGPRALDVAYWLMSDLFHADAIGIARAPGWPTQHEVLARYREASGTDVTDIDYFIVMGAFFMGTTLIRATDNGIAAGRLPPGSTMGHANTLTQILADRLGMTIPPLSPDFIAHRGLPAGTMGLANQTAP